MEHKKAWPACRWVSRLAGASALMGALAALPAALLAAQIDLHSHSYCSDGIQTPETMVGAAKQMGLDVYALTDHDTVACLDRARAKARELGVRLISGIEISAEDDSMHILGIGIDPGNSALSRLLANTSRERRNRLMAILDKLSRIGAPLDLEKDILLPKLNFERRLDGLPPVVNSPGVDALFAQIRGQITRPDVARALVRQRYAANSRDAFDRYIGDDAPAGIPLQGPSFAAVIATIHEAGGLAVLAHPYTISQYKKFPVTYSGRKFKTFEGLARSMLGAGLDGFEAYRSTWEKYPSRVKRLQKIAASFTAHSGRAVLFTAGSDYHGYSPDDPNRLGGKSLGVPDVPEDAQAQMIRALRHAAL